MVTFTCSIASQAAFDRKRGNYNGKLHKYLRITTNQPETKSNPNHNTTTKQHAIASIQL